MIITMKNHYKHPPVIRQNTGMWGRNEFSFTGTDCGRIREFCLNLSQQLNETHHSIYIDASHKESTFPTEFPSEIIQEGENFIHFPFQLNNQLLRNAYLNPFDLILINGNHHKGAKQIVFLQKDKEVSIRKRAEQLDNIKMFISVDGTQPWDFIKKTALHSPVFHINNPEKIITWFKNQLIPALPPLKGLVLAGGKSSRMGEDKGSIKYHKTDQREYLCHLLRENNIENYISCRPDQTDQLFTYSLITDTFINAGPMGAIISAFKTDPNAAWLVMAVDMPGVVDITLKTLLQERSYKHFATCFHNDATDFPEPLLTIYEPKSYLALMQTFALGYLCPRKFLIHHPVKSIRQKNQNFLININTPEERKRWEDQT